MGQIHKRFSSEQVKQLLEGYIKGLMDRADIEDVLGIILTPLGGGHLKEIEFILDKEVSG